MCTKSSKLMRIICCCYCCCYCCWRTHAQSIAKGKRNTRLELNLLCCHQMSAIHFKRRCNKMCMRFFSSLLSFITIIEFNSNGFAFTESDIERISMSCSFCFNSYSIAQSANEQTNKRTNVNSIDEKAQPTHKHKNLFIFHPLTETVFIVSLKFRKISELNKKETQNVCHHLHLFSFIFILVRSHTWKVYLSSLVWLSSYLCWCTTITFQPKRYRKSNKFCRVCKTCS